MGNTKVSKEQKLEAVERYLEIVSHGATQLQKLGSVLFYTTLLNNISNRDMNLKLGSNKDSDTYELIATGRPLNNRSFYDKLASEDFYKDFDQEYKVIYQEAMRIAADIICNIAMKKFHGDPVKKKKEINPNELVSFKYACDVYPELEMQNVDPRRIGIVINVNERYGKKNQKYFQTVTRHGFIISTMIDDTMVVEPILEKEQKPRQ